MSWLSQIFGFFKSFQCWVTIAPWEMGLRVRLGKTATVLRPGPHLRIPFLDRIFIQPVRLRTIEPPTITLTTKDGKTLSLKIALRYQIEDILLLHLKVATPENTILTAAQHSISAFVGNNNASDITHERLCECIASTPIGKDWGIGNVSLLILTFASCRTIRLLMQDYQTTSRTNDLSSTTDPAY